MRSLWHIGRHRAVWLWVLGVAALIVVAALSAGCTDRNETFIQGSWLYSEPTVGGVGTASSVHTFWTFDHGSFDANSCCENRGSMQGSYRIVESNDDTLVLDLYDIEDDAGTEDYTLTIKLDRERGALFLQGTGPYLRVSE